MTLRAIAGLAGIVRLRAPITRTVGFDDLDQAFAAGHDGAVGKLAVRC